MATFSFNSVEKPSMEVELPDGKHIKVLMPKKRTMENILGLKTELTDVTDIQTIELMYKVIVEILNNNENGINLTVEDVEGIDIGDAVIFVNEYVNFITENKTEKN